MANIPGAGNSLPGVYGPLSYPVKKIENGYYIKGYGAEFRGSPRDIAKQIILNITKKPEPGVRKNYTGPFYVQIKPEPRCSFCMNPKPDPQDLDVRTVSEEITIELQSLIKLIPFS